MILIKFDHPKKNSQYYLVYICMFWATFCPTLRKSPLPFNGKFQKIDGPGVHFRKKCVNFPGCKSRRNTTKPGRVKLRQVPVTNQWRIDVKNCARCP